MLFSFYSRKKTLTICIIMEKEIRLNLLQISCFFSFSAVFWFENKRPFQSKQHNFTKHTQGRHFVIMHNVKTRIFSISIVNLVCFIWNPVILSSLTPYIIIFFQRSYPGILFWLDPGIYVIDETLVLCIRHTLINLHFGKVAEGTEKWNICVTCAW